MQVPVIDPGTHRGSRSDHSLFSRSPRLAGETGHPRINTRQLDGSSEEGNRPWG